MLHSTPQHRHHHRMKINNISLPPVPPTMLFINVPECQVQITFIYVTRHKSNEYVVT